MSKVAIVVHCCHDKIAGGSEALAWQYAQLLSGPYEVEVLTSAARDYVTWANHFKPGVTKRQGVTVRRFAVDIGRSDYWHRLHDRVRKDYDPAAPGGGTNVALWSLPLQEEFIRHQGPYCGGLLQFVEERWQDYRALLFVTYLYPTSYFGLNHVPRGRALLVPTLHDEPAAFLPAFRHMARRARSVLWLSAAEQTLGHRLWGELPGRVTAMAVHTEPAAPAKSRRPYVLYSGRIDPIKGCDHLLKYFLAYKEKHPSDLRLVLTGADKLGLPRHPDIDYRGFVSEKEKFALMAGARAFLMPSPYESFSVATLEAMAQRTPVLVNGTCGVLADHVRLSGAGMVYGDEASFCAGLGEVLDETKRAALGERGRAYVAERYAAERVREGLVQEVEACAAGARSVSEGKAA